MTSMMNALLIVGPAILGMWSGRVIVARVERRLTRRRPYGMIVLPTVEED